MTRIDTDRLLLREWHDDDLDALAAMNSDPEVMRYILDGATLDRAESARRLQRYQRAWAEQGIGLFAVEAGGGLVGWAGFAVPEFLPEVLPAIEIGWRFARETWGRGYATEAAAAALRWGFDEYGLERVISIRHPDNVRSERVMTKIGLVHDFDTVIPGADRPAAVHAVDRAAFRKATISSSPG
ncbi:GNAT family N-acetyltransferase [Symbioplanes lichenis]|uniref:GNAT family N-acetyltransferase n=1 Tax=Symbioplanes lichenis TaxID=1629072 RepID=UPI002738A2F3|nr:GNAT family N-acetyltransferase [Actinoplanes lichenis]